MKNNHLLSLMAVLLLLQAVNVQAQDITTGEYHFQQDGTTPQMQGHATQDHIFVRNANCDNVIMLPDGDVHQVWFYLDDDEIYNNAEVQALTPIAYNADGDLYNEITYNSFQFNIYVPQGISITTVLSDDGNIRYEPGDRLPRTAYLSWGNKGIIKRVDGVDYDVYTVVCFNSKGYGSHLSGKDAQHYKENGALKKDATLFALYFKSNLPSGSVKDIIISSLDLNVRETIIAEWDNNKSLFFYGTGGNDESQRFDLYNRVKVYCGTIAINGISYCFFDNSAIVVCADENENGNIAIPSTVTYQGKTYEVTGIGDNAFLDNSWLRTVTIPQSITTIGDNAFNGCTGLTRITVDAGNPVFDSRGSCNAIIETATNTLIAGCKSTVIPQTVTSIGHHAFRGCSELENINIPQSVNKIGSYAFAACSGLKSIEIPNAVSIIEDCTFNGCSALASVTIPESVTLIGNQAFSGCFVLDSVTCYAQVPPELQSSVFFQVPDDMIVYVPLFVIDDYEKANGWYKFTILPIRSNQNKLTVFFPGNVSVVNYAQMRLELMNGDESLHYIIDDNMCYTFYGIKYGAHCSVVLSNQYGDVFGRIDDLIIEADTIVAFPSLAKPNDVSLSVKTPAGQDVTGQCKVEWMDEQGRLLLQGSTIKGLPAGKRLTYKVMLPAELAANCTMPAGNSHTVYDGYNNIVYQLSEINQACMGGMVTDAISKLPLSGAVVTAIQSFGDNNTKTLTTQTDYNGHYTLDASSVPTTIMVSASGYITQTIEAGELLGDGGEVILPDVALTPITGAVVNVNLTYTRAHTSGAQAEVENWYSDYNNVDFMVYNKTAGHDINHISIQFPQIVLMEDVNDGDVLKITATSRKNAFKPIKSTVTIADQKASATFNILERGKIAARFEKNSNPDVVGTLYDSNGKLVSTNNYAADTLTVNDLADGSYRLITMGKSEFFNTIYDLNQFATSGLQEGVDYAKNSVDVIAGLISEAIVEDVPPFDESKFYYTGELTAFTVNKPSVVIGNFITFRAQVDFKQQYAPMVKDVQLIVDLPESCLFYENSVLIGTNAVGYTINGNRITIPLVNYDGNGIRLSAIPTVEGEFAPSAFVRFSLNGKTITQPIGNANFVAQGLSINVPSKVTDTVIPISGTAVGVSDIAIYDNDVLIGQTTSLANGKWSINCQLNEPYNLSIHHIYARTTNQHGLELSTKLVSCYYVKNDIKVSKVSMYHHNPELSKTFEVVFDFLNPSSSNQYYVYYIYKKDFSFLIDFTTNDPSLIQDVELYVKTAKSGWWPLEATYDENKGRWVAHGKFGNMYNGDLPVSVAVDYTINHDEDVIEWAPLDAYIDNLNHAFEEEDSVSTQVDQIIDQLEDGNLSSSDLNSALDNILITTRVIRSAGEEVNLKPRDKGVLDRVGNIPDSEERNRAINEELDNRDTTPSADYSKLDQSLKEPIDSVIPPDDDNDPDIDVKEQSPEDWDENTDLFKDVVVQDYELICGGIRVDTRRVIGETIETDEEYNRWMNNVQSLIHDNWTSMSSLGISVFNQIALNEVARCRSELFFDCQLLRLNLSREPNLSTLYPDTYNTQLNSIRSSAQQLTNANRTVNTLRVVGNVASGLSAFQGGWSVGSDIRVGLQENNEWNTLIKKIEECDDPNALTIASLAREYKEWIRTRYVSKGIADFGSSCLGVAGAALAPETAGLSLALNLGSFAVGLATSHWQNQFTRTNTKNYREVMGMYKNLNCSKNNGPDSDSHPIPDKDFTQGDKYPGSDVSFNIDPSGFVYEGVPSHRLQGVIATCYYKDTSTDEPVLWDAAQYEQENPLLTDENGYYRWDVPIGMWQVKYEKEGYETTYSDWLPVPPPQLDVNIGMVQMCQPEVIKARAYPKAVELEFDKYMLPETLTTENITVSVNGTLVSGSIELLNAEVDDPNAITSIRRAPGTGLTLASRVRFNADKPFNADKVTLHVNYKVESYAGLMMNEDYEAVLPLELEMQEIVADSVVVMPYMESKQLKVSVLPAAASAGKVINVVSIAPMIAMTDAEQYTLDGNGGAVITVHGDLPGVTSLLYSIEGYDLTASTLVEVKMVSEMTVALPTASIASGSVVDKGSEVYLYCKTEGATIYYTLDGSCPCDPSDARMVYDGTPIIINGNVTIKAMAVAEGLFDSDVATFIYRVKGLKGDVNGDGVVNISDINQLIDYILRARINSETMERGDVNGDGTINISDVNVVIQIILGSGSGAHAPVNTADLLHMNDLELRPGEMGQLHVTVDNAQQYSALQCDIVLPEGLTLVGVNPVDGYIGQTGAVDDMTSRALTYSMMKTPFTVGESVLTLTVRADAALGSDSRVSLTNVVLSDADNASWYAEDCKATVNNASGVIDQTTVVNRVWVEGRTLCISTRQDGEARVVAVNGMMRRLDVAAGVTRLQLEPGIYIVVLNGKSHKVMIK